MFFLPPLQLGEPKVRRDRLDSAASHPDVSHYPGSDKADALPSVTSGKDADGGDSKVVEEIEKTAEDLDSVFKDIVQRAMVPAETHEVKEAPSMDDSNRTFRTRLVSIWLLTNGALVIAIS